MPIVAALLALATATACTAEGTPAPRATATRAASASSAPGVVNAAGVAAQAAPTMPAPSPTATLTKTPTSKPRLGIADITPMGEKAEKVGVGFPIIVTFDRDVRDRAATEAALEVRAEKPVEGAWRWVSPRKVIYRTKTYWKPHQKVLFKARLSQIPGNEAAKDVSRRFAVGTANISVVDTRRHVMKVRRDGKLAKTIPISAGRGGLLRNGVDVYLTTSGVHLTMGKKALETMTSSWMGVTDPKDPRYYKEQILWAVRISDSGEYVHQSYGDYQYLGRSNQSHGCVRATPAGAKWFYTIAQRGDVVKIVGTKRKLDWRNGWSYWQLNWTQWKKGSALKG
ncbi:lipoprotein-anchoring transpeptidase ErfK/SrfK [Nonomuraea muscovyensis]|uniref:Lipoprotein-anchoring transpeptidase ErfK/SrfK n=1 Tax=Nonomuraea muscovyensis TaxID=1124761 RepID=A0A7X0F060_9ACTN|nr:L,D-transpeptidase [Nonomuraea muscovyensis]MBB6350553.1 lipoprotein-anchoring transpeptidase ErfK/SrfK [Nonomuraea muscovyensis]